MCFHIPPLHTVLLCFRHHGYQAQFFQGSCSVQMLSALWIYNLEGLYCSPGVLMICITGLHIFTLWKRYRDVSYTLEFLYKGNLRISEVVELLSANVPGWAALHSPSFPASGFSALKRYHINSCSLQLGAASSDRNTKNHQGTTLTCRFLGQI